MTALLWSLALVPAVLGAVLCLGGRVLDRWAVPGAITVSTFVLAAATAVAVGRPTVSAPFVAGSNFGLSVDGLSAPIVVTIAVVSLLVLIYAAAEPVTPRPRFHGLMLLFVAAVMITATATTLPALLFAWELMGAASYALIGFSWKDTGRVSSGLTAFLTTRAADIGLYLAAGAALAAGSTLSLDGLARLPDGYRDAVAAGILVAALGKSAQVPFTFWLSRAMVGPSPVSALLHSAAMVAMGGYVLLRVSPLLQSTSWAADTTAWIGAATALIFGAVAVAQRDLKQLLAASTAAQLGFVVLAAGLGSVAGGAAQLIAHAATKSLLFLVAGAWLAALGTKNLEDLRGAARRWPVTGALFTVGALSLAGIAPLSLWATKDHVLAAAGTERPALYVVGLAAAGLSAAYAGKALVVAWSAPAAEPNLDSEETGTRRIARWQQVPLVPLAVGAAALGVLTFDSVLAPIAEAVGLPTTPAPGALELVWSAVLAVVVLLLVWRVAVPEPAWARSWLGLERATHLVVVRPVLATAAALARFDDRGIDRTVTAVAAAARRGSTLLAKGDDRILDGVVSATSAATIGAGGRAARADDRGVDGSVEILARLTRRLGTLTRRIQTGQLHQYYVLVVAVSAAAVLLVLVVR
ncbi:MAG: proton-conducting transporter membrane subunit [Rhodococcus sp. (in: high G+C Gram-positive bacteria)]